MAIFNSYVKLPEGTWFGFKILSRQEESELSICFQWRDRSKLCVLSPSSLTLSSFWNVGRHDHMSWNHSGNELRPHIFQDPIYFSSNFLRVMMKSDKFWWKSVEIWYPEASDSWHHSLPQHFPFFQSAMTHKVSAQRCSRGSRTACHTSLERNITMRPLRGARSTKRSWSGAVADSWQYRRVHWVYQDLKDFYGCLWICALQIFAADGFPWFS